MQIKVVFPCVKEPSCFPHNVFFAIKTSRNVGPTTYEFRRERRHFQDLYIELQLKTRRGLESQQVIISQTVNKVY